MITNKSNLSIKIYIKKEEVLLITCFFLFYCNSFGQKEYQKTYYNNGKIKKEGWLINDKKNGYWKFYHNNGVLKKEGWFKDDFPIKYWYFYRKNSYKEKEGHFIDGKQSKWWLYYDNEGFVNHKCQLKDNKKNGYCLLYDKNKLIKAVKFKNGKKIKEWTSFSSFRKENNMSDLK
ncbi:toxin-antitoxin system YwqK family antitoxin [Tenacibaculum maritimum]|uniref:toxin-antitoxin system YwqK family antitoxin n=1 Tax=Tenacibaculum maritimum TaxID=107401 RepID=UPI003876333D